MRLKTLLIAALASTVLVAGCQALKNPRKDWDAQRYYEEAKAAMAGGNYKDAIEFFEGLEARYPYGRYAEQAQLEIAYAYYKNDQPELAIQAADRFIRLHPTHPYVSYAYYLKGIVNVRQDKGFSVNRLFKKKRAKALDRDAKSAHEAYLAFREVAERFPNSPYARDATLRMAHLNNSLAKYEVEVARYYMNQDAYVAAANRCKYVIENHQRAPAVEDALGVQAQAYNAMGLTQLMQDTLRVLEANFPSSRYLQDIYEPSGKKKRKKDKKKKEQPLIQYGS
ncbi:MAG: outer membrane protein assembly factor BamD [Acidiferrobacterales bacterium]